MNRRQLADVSAAVVAALVLLLGALAVVKPAFDHWGDVYRDNPFEARQTTKKVVKQVPGKPAETTTTDSEASATFLERSLGDSGLLILRLGVVALAAFLAGAVVQRVVLGDFALKVGPVEVPALATTAEASKKGLQALRSDLKRTNRDALARDARLQRALADVSQRVAASEETPEEDNSAKPGQGDV